MTEKLIDSLIGQTVRIEVTIGNEYETFDGVLRKLSNVYVVNEGASSYVHFKFEDISQCFEGSVNNSTLQVNL